MPLKKAENGDIYRCIRATMAKVHDSDKARRQVIEDGELVEFRFWNPANVRTKDGLYLTIEEKEFEFSFEYYGRILEDVYRRNQNTTAEILDCKLYTPVRP